MTRSLTRLSLFATLALVTSGTVFAQDADTKFREGLDLLKRGQDEAALESFREALAADPDQEAAYELWQSTDAELWLKMLRKEGQFELVAKRFMHLATAGKKAVSNDEDKIRGLVGQLSSDDVQARFAAQRELAANHGEYAAPFLIYQLANQGDDAARTAAMVALPRLGDVVVPPMLEALETNDAYLRRNLALTLGRIGDRRAQGHLAALASSDEDSTVRQAASDALARWGSQGTDAQAALLGLGEGFHNRSPLSLRPHQYSEVIWDWNGSGLDAVETPRFLYAEEMAKKAYYAALDLNPSSADALAGIARVTLAEQELVNEFGSAGADLGDWADRLAQDQLAVAMAGPEALSNALSAALSQGDDLAASGLCRALANVARSASPALETAMTAADSGAVRGEAAVALANIAVRQGTTAGPGVVEALASAGGRDVVRLVGVIDADASRRTDLVSRVSNAGTSVVGWASAGRGLASLSSVPGLDALIVADELPDLTTDQVITELRNSQRFAETPILVVANDTDRAEELFGELASGVMGTADMSALDEALSQNMNRDREQANDLAGRAASAIAALAVSGRTDCSQAADGLAGSLALRPEDVAKKALGALREVGGGSHVGDVIAALTDDSKGDDLRVAAADALGGIFGRIGSVDQATVQELVGLASGDGSLALRQATASALGALNLDSDVRAELMRALRQ